MNEPTTLTLNAPEAAATDRQRTFLKTCIAAYQDAYYTHFAPVGYHEIAGQFCEDLKALDAREKTK